VQIYDMSGAWNAVDVKFNNGGLSYFTALSFGKTYKARVRVWDSKGGVSEWKESEPWSPPKHPYPQVGFSWTPISSFIDEAVSFTDRTVYSDGSASTGQRKWLWDFGDGESAEVQNPTHYYAGFGTFGIVATVTDKDGYACTSLVPGQILVRRK
jgi:PKD repeat protein